MKKYLAPLAAVVALAVPTAASAAAPNGEFTANPNAKSQGSCIGKLSSRITQNGQFVSGQENAYGVDQTTYPGSRADAVHAAQGSC